MPRLKAAFSPFLASCSRAPLFDRVNFRRTARHSRRTAANWSFHQYIEPLACLHLRRGIEQSQAVTTFCLAQRTVASNYPAGQTQPSPSMSLVSSRCFPKSFPAKSSCVPGRAPFFAASILIHCLAPFLQAELEARMVTQGFLTREPINRLSLRRGQARQSRSQLLTPPPTLLV